MIFFDYNDDKLQMLVSISLSQKQIQQMLTFTEF